MRYIGGKNHAGTYQRIINLIPPHDVYIEGCVGSGAILRMKKPAASSYAVDKNGRVLGALDRAAPNLTLVDGDIITWLRRFKWGRDVVYFIYLDPPYLSSVRGGRRYYVEEMSEPDHRRLLALIKRLPANVHVMISGYPSPLYDTELAGWEREEFTVYTRTHQKRTEVLWMNYPRPDTLHDLRYVGGNYRQRWNEKKRQRRWVEKLKKMDVLQRGALMAAIREVGLGG